MKQIYKMLLVYSNKKLILYLKQIDVEFLSSF